jgi:hypothetical protein
MLQRDLCRLTPLRQQRCQAQQVGCCDAAGCWLGPIIVLLEPQLDGGVGATALEVAACIKTIIITSCSVSTRLIDGYVPAGVCYESTQGMQTRSKPSPRPPLLRN